MSQYWYIATRRFGPFRGAEWKKYLQWSKLNHLREVVSLDGILCAPVGDDLSDEDWLHNVHDDHCLTYFHDLEYLIRRTDALAVGANILAVIRNPVSDCRSLAPGKGMYFAGYDLIELATGVSALTNCGGFAGAFSPADLNDLGLIGDFARASEVRRKLALLYPDEPHANCKMMAIWRLSTKDFVQTTIDDVILRESFVSPALVRLHVRNLEDDLSAAPDLKAKASMLGETGYCKRVLGQLSEAEESLKEALKLVQSDASALRQTAAYSIRLAHVYHWQCRWDDALAMFGAQLKLCSDNENLQDMRDFVFQHRGKMYFDKGDLAAAENDFLSALALREEKGAVDLVASTRQALAALKLRTIRNN